MKLPSFASLLLCSCIFVPSVSFATGPEASRIFGIAKFVIGTNSVEVTRDDSLPYELDLIPGSGGSEMGTKSLTIGIGNSFTVSDRHHVSTTYRLLKISGDVARMEEIRSTHFPDKREHQSTHTVLIRSYGVMERSQSPST